MIRTRNLMHLTDPSSNVFASVSSFNLPFFDSPIVATTKKINSVTSLSWNTKILNVVFIACIFYFSAGNFSLFLPQMSTFHPYYQPEKTAGSPAQSFLPGQKKKKGKKMSISFGKTSPWTHLYYTKAVFYNNPPFNPTVRKEHNDLDLPMGAGWRRGKIFHSRETTRWPSAWRNNVQISVCLLEMVPSLPWAHTQICGCAGSQAAIPEAGIWRAFHNKAAAGAELSLSLESQKFKFYSKSSLKLSPPWL